MLNHFFHLTLTRKAALITAISTALTCTVIVLASHHGSKQIIHSSTTLFGENLIQKLSRDASNPLVRNDKLSLQALLNELVNSQIVTHAVIYDIENHPITESGKHYDGLSLSASITFQDSIAGYAVITLNSQSLQQQALSLSWQLITLTILLSILIYLLSAIPANYVSRVLNDLRAMASYPRSKEKRRISYRGRDELQGLAQQILQGPDEPDKIQGHNDEQASLSLEVTNLNQLQQQMGIHATKELFIACYKQLCVISKLYDGHIAISGPNRFSLQFFPTDNEDSYPFRALCSGFLIQQWVNTSKSLLSIDIGLALKNNRNSCELENELAVQETLEQARIAGLNGAGNMVATVALCSHPSVSQRVNTQPLKHNNNNSSLVIDNLAEPYRELLMHQLTTLNSQLIN